MPLAFGVLLAAVLTLVEVEVGTGRGAAVGGVAELVDVEAVQPRLQVADLARDPNRVGSRRNVLKRDECTSVQGQILTG